MLRQGHCRAELCICSAVFIGEAQSSFLEMQRPLRNWPGCEVDTNLHPCKVERIQDTYQVLKLPGEIRLGSQINLFATRSVAESISHQKNGTNFQSTGHCHCPIAGKAIVYHSFSELFEG